MIWTENQRLSIKHICQGILSPYISDAPACINKVKNWLVKEKNVDETDSIIKATTGCNWKCHDDLHFFVLVTLYSVHGRVYKPSGSAAGFVMMTFITNLVEQNKSIKRAKLVSQPCIDTATSFDAGGNTEEKNGVVGSYTWLNYDNHGYGSRTFLYF